MTSEELHALCDRVLLTVQLTPEDWQSPRTNFTNTAES